MSLQAGIPESRAPRQERPLLKSSAHTRVGAKAQSLGQEPPGRTSGTILSAHTEQGTGSVLISQREKPHSVKALGRACMFKSFTLGGGKKKISRSNAALVTPDKPQKQDLKGSHCFQITYPSKKLKEYL